MANYLQELAQDAECQSHTGHMTELLFLPARPLRLNTNEWMTVTYDILAYYLNWHMRALEHMFLLFTYKFVL